LRALPRNRNGLKASQRSFGSSCIYNCLITFLCPKSRHVDGSAKVNPSCITVMALGRFRQLCSCTSTPTLEGCLHVLTCIFAGRRTTRKLRIFYRSRKYGYVMASSQPPPPAYDTPKSNKELYDKILNSTRSRVSQHVVPPRSGHAFVVPAGRIFRLTTSEGPQVGDLNLWNLDNPRERFWASRTRQLHASHVSVGDRLWSCLPFLRPMATIIADSLSDYGVDRFGGRCHDLLGTR
jgi:hypothetical protein